MAHLTSGACLALDLDLDLLTLLTTVWTTCQVDHRHCSIPHRNVMGLAG